jgi:hypothetical protein
MPRRGASPRNHLPDTVRPWMKRPTPEEAQARLAAARKGRIRPRGTPEGERKFAELRLWVNGSLPRPRAGGHVLQADAGARAIRFVVIAPPHRAVVEVKLDDADGQIVIHRLGQEIARTADVEEAGRRIADAIAGLTDDEVRSFNSAAVKAPDTQRGLLAPVKARPVPPPDGH